MNSQYCNYIFWILGTSNNILYKAISRQMFQLGGVGRLLLFKLNLLKHRFPAQFKLSKLRNEFCEDFNTDT